MGLLQDNQYQDEHTHLRKTLDFIARVLLLLRKRAGSKPQHMEAHLAEISRSQIGQFESARDKPYFGRIDIIENGHSETIYIGDKGLEDPDTLDRWVVNWQSPIAAVFYEFTGAEKEIVYHGPDGKPISVRVLRKRQLEVKRGKLLNVFEVNSSDSKDTRNHEYLDAALSRTTDGALQTITETIQKEQNAVIRFPKDTPVIVQGVAGSGKTSIGVHRVSYLLFNHKNSLKPADVLVLGPNETFLEHISAALPALQSTGINRRTFTTWAEEVMRCQLKMRSLHDLLRQMRETRDGVDEYSIVARIKGSLDFADALGRYIRDVEIDLLANLELELRPELFISSRHLLYMYFQENSHYSANVKRQRVLKSVKNWVDENIDRMLQAIRQDEERTNWTGIVNRPELRSKLSQQQINAAKRRAALIKELARKYDDFAAKWPELDVFSLYESFATDFKKLKEYLPALTNYEVEAIASHTLRARKDGVWDPEDLAALLYVNSLVVRPLPNYGHIIVDEAQDLTALEISLVIRASRNRSMTLLGDMQQSIYFFRSISGWAEVMGMFDKTQGVHEPQIIELRQSYRSTKQITLASNVLLNDKNRAHPIGRQGIKPVAIQVDSPKELMTMLVENLKGIEAKDYGLIGLVGNTVVQCKAIYDKLHHEGFRNLQLLLEPTEGVHEKILILPEFIAKGLEFDACMILNAGENRFGLDPLSKKLLYVLMTRARHELIMFYYQQIATPLQSEVKNGNLFDVVSTFDGSVSEFSF